MTNKILTSAIVLKSILVFAEHQKDKIANLEDIQLWILIITVEVLQLFAYHYLIFLYKNRIYIEDRTRYRSNIHIMVFIPNTYKLIVERLG